MQIREKLEVLALPLTFLAMTITLRICWWFFDLPPAEVVAKMAGDWINAYGLPVIFISAMIEGMLLVGGYFPGIFVIFISILLADSPTEAAVAVAVGSAGLVIAHVINYALGRYGWYRLLVKFGLSGALSGAKRNIEKKGAIAIFSSYWLPSLAALTDTAAGILHMPFKKFFAYSLLGVVFWDTVVGVLMYVLKDSALAIISPGGTDLKLVLVIVVVWSTVLLILDHRKKNKMIKNEIFL